MASLHTRADRESASTIASKPAAQLRHSQVVLWNLTGANAILTMPDHGANREIEGRGYKAIVATQETGTEHEHRHGVKP